MSIYDALVIGAGPVGSHVAYKLASLGYRVAVFEEHEKVGQLSCCTGIISRECVERFCIPKEVILREAGSAKLFSPSGNCLRLWKEEPQACIVNRVAFDGVWAQQAQGEGAEYFLSSRVRELVFSHDSVRANFERHNEEAQVEGKTAVIASGFGSKLPQRLGLGRMCRFITGAQTEVSVNGVDEVEVYLGHGIAPGAFAWLVPISHDRALLGLLSHKKPGLYLENLLASLSRERKIAATEAKVSYGGIPLQSLPKTYGERVIVVGDAAGQVKPTTGGGIYYGLLSAESAAETIHQALSSSDFSQRLFSQYEQVWKNRLGRELRIGYFARYLYERVNDRQIDEIFRFLRTNGIVDRLLQSPHLAFDWQGEFILSVLRHLAPWQKLRWRPWRDSNPQPTA